MSTSLDAWRAAGRAYTYRGHPGFVRVSGPAGAEPALLCIHGFPTASWDWHALWDGLTSRFACVIAPDMLGFGFSAKPRGYAYRLTDQAELHETLLAELGVRRVHLLAHDYGDSVAQELLARHIDRRGDGLALLSVCLLNGGLFPEAHRPTLVQRLVASPLGPLAQRFVTEASFGRSLSAVFGAHTKPDAAQLRAFWALVSAEGGTAIAHDLLAYIAERRVHRERWVQALAASPVPVRVIDGADDPVSGRHMVERYRALVPAPDTVLLEGIGHYPQVEAPGAVLEAFLAFHARIGTPVPERPAAL